MGYEALQHPTQEVHEHPQAIYIDTFDPPISFADKSMPPKRASGETSAGSVLSCAGPSASKGLK